MEVAMDEDTVSSQLRLRARALAAPVDALQFALDAVRRLLQAVASNVFNLHEIEAPLRILGSSAKGYGVVHDPFGIACDLNLDWFLPSDSATMRTAIDGKQFVQAIIRIAEDVQQFLTAYRLDFLGVT